MTADDVKYSLDRVTNPKTQSPGSGFFGSIKGYDDVAAGNAESLSGVTVVDPATTWVDVDVELAQDVTLLPGTQLHGATVVAQGATIGPDTTLTDVHVGPGASVVRTHGSSARIGAGALVGPFAYLRPGTSLGERGKIGTFVETKNAEIGDGASLPMPCHRMGLRSPAS